MRLDPGSSCFPTPRAPTSSLSDDSGFSFVAVFNSFVVLRSLRFIGSKDLLHIVFGFDIPLSIYLKIFSSLLVSSSFLALHGLPFFNMNSVSSFVYPGGLSVSVFIVEHIVLGSTGVFAHSSTLASFHPFSII